MVQAEPRPAGHPAGRREGGERGGAARSLPLAGRLSARPGSAPARLRLRPLRLVTELPVFAETQLLFPELPPAPCDQRARHWLPIIPAFAYS